MEPNNKSVVTRFAPSPTGYLHIGGVRTALYAYLFAKKNNGTFILRIEDTDKAREVAGSIAHIQESLLWLGIKWDYGPEKPGEFTSCLQSERLPIYHKYAQQLIAKGLAYPDPYTQEEVEVFRQDAAAKKTPFLFRNHRPTEAEEWDGKKPLRLKVPTIKRYIWNDAVRGKLSAGEEMLDDFILIKSDGYPTYNFAHIIDDLEMGVTHIMRADEFISSTPKFLSLYDALEIPYPVFATLPPILREDRTKKLGKRDGAKDILDYRTEGYLPEAMANFLALIGWNPGTDQEIFSMEELIEVFTLEKIQKAGGAFNEEKLDWMNKEYLKKYTDTEFLNYLQQTEIKEETEFINLIPSDRLERALSTIRERLSVRVEFYKSDEDGGREFDYLIMTKSYETELLKWKNDDSVDNALPRLEHLKSLIESASTDAFASIEAVKELIWPYAEETGKGEVLWPLRVALCGTSQSPDPFTLAYILGPEETIQRIVSACDKIQSNAS
ncbi:MAG: glutamate--tRNA ligase [Candidatus Paceibacteria bacterium]